MRLVGEEKKGNITLALYDCEINLGDRIK